MLQKKGPLTRPESFIHGKCIAIRLGTGSNLFLSLCGSWIQVQELMEKGKRWKMFVSDVHPVDELSLLVKILAKERQRFNESGGQILKKSADKTVGLLDPTVHVRK